MADIKLQTKISSFQDVQKSLQEIEKRLNELLLSVNEKSETEVSDKDGKTGDIQVTQNVDKSYNFEVRTQDGWKTPVLGESAIKFTDKPSSFSQKIDKSIDDIESDDTSTGSTKATKTIFDEKNNKFSVAHLTGIPRPDYDSGWMDIDRTDTDKDGFTLAHGLTFSNSAPSLVMAWVKDSYGDIDGASATNIIYPWKRLLYTAYNTDWRGMDWRIDSTNLYIQAYSSYRIFWNWQDDDGTAGVHKYWDRMDGRILLWK